MRCGNQRLALVGAAVMDRIAGKQVSFDDAQDGCLAANRLVDGMIFPKAPKRYQLVVRHILFLLNNTVMQGDAWTTAEEDRLSFSDKPVHPYERLRDAHLKLKPHAGREPFESVVVDEINEAQKKFYQYKPNRHVVAAVLEARGDIEQRFNADAPFSAEAPGQPQGDFAAAPSSELATTTFKAGTPADARRRSNVSSHRLPNRRIGSGDASGKRASGGRRS